MIWNRTMKMSPLKQAMMRFCVLLLALLATASSSPAQSKPRSSASFVTVTNQLSSPTVQAGRPFRVTMLLGIAKGWHIQSSKPAQDYLIPTTLTFAPEEGTRLGKISYPKTVPILFSGETIEVFEGQVPLRFDVKLSPTIASGRHVLHGKLTVQACDDKTCLAPSTVDVEIPFEVVGAETPVTQSNLEPLPVQSSVPGPPSSSSNEAANPFANRGTLLAFVAIFFIGLALNLTPCVYPMLSVTVSIFGAQTETSTARVFAKAVLYVLGMATMYSILGCAAAFSGKLFGGALQNRWVLVAISALFVVLALSMFGLFELRMPSALTNRLGGTTTAGLAGIYVSGLVVGIFAAPCAGPPVIGLLVEVAKRGDPWFGFLSFFTLSLGLGSPYLVLGTFSGLLKKLPRSGVWMEWVKKVFGVALIGVALFYLSLAFLPTMVKWIPALTLLGGGAYLGFIERSGRDKKTFLKVKWAVGGLAMIGGLALLVTEPKETLTWEPYHPARLAAARAASQPVILDFYADWCIPCHELDRKTFSDPDVMRALGNFVRLKVNLTRYDSPESDAIRQKFNIQGVPTVILLGHDGEEIPDTRIIGFLPADELLRQTKLKGS